MRGVWKIPSGGNSLQTSALMKLISRSCWPGDVYHQVSSSHVFSVHCLQSGLSHCFVCKFNESGVRKNFSSPPGERIPMRIRKFFKLWRAAQNNPGIHYPVRSSSDCSSGIIPTKVSGLLLIFRIVRGFVRRMEWVGCCFPIAG